MNSKLGICEWSLPLPGPYNCKTVSEFGLGGIVLDIGSYERDYQLSKKRVQNDYIQAAKDWNVVYPSITINDLNYYSITEPKGLKNREIACTAIKKCIDVAAVMNIPVVFLPSFNESAIKDENDIKMTIECIQEMLDYSKGTDIKICTENVLSADENIRLIKALNNNRFKIYFDTQNPYLEKGYYIPDLIRKLYPYIQEVHVKDGLEGDLSGALLGEGKTDFFESMKVLHEAGYTGWLVLENYYSCKPLSTQNEDPFELLKKDIEILRTETAKLS